MQGKFGAYSAQSTLARKRLSPWRSFNSPKQGSTIVVRRRYFACRSTSDINSPVSLRPRAFELATARRLGTFSAQRAVPALPSSILAIVSPLLILAMVSVKWWKRVEPHVWRVQH